MEQLIKKLKLIERITFNDWRTLCSVVEALNQKGSKVISSEWLESHKLEYPDLHPLDLTKLNTWSTYEKCFILNFSIKNKKIICNALIYNGDNLDGWPTTKRFKAEISLNLSFIKLLEHPINKAFNGYLDLEYQTYLENQKISWIQEFKEKILQ